MKRSALISFSCLLLVCLLLLTACKNPGSYLASADEKLTATPYTVTVTTRYDCDLPSLQTEVFDALSVTVPVTVDGDSLSIRQKAEVMAMPMDVTITVVDGVLFYEMTNGSFTTKQTCTLSQKQRADFLQARSAALPVDHIVFAKVTAESANGGRVITATGLTEDGRKALVGLAEDALRVVSDAKVEIGESTYTATLQNGRYESVKLTCPYTITIGEQTYTLTLTAEAVYDYTEVTPLVAPSDKDAYQVVKYKDIFN